MTTGARNLFRDSPALLRMLGIRAVALRSRAAIERKLGLTRWRLRDGGGAAPHALDMPVFGAADLRPVWEANRWACLPDDPVPAVLAWMAANPPFRGPNWISAQEAALRLLHLAPRVALPAPAALHPAIAAHARRIDADAAYEASQDNNHVLAHHAGRIVAAAMLGRSGASAVAALHRAAGRLIAPCGAFSQHSATYQRMACDVLWAAGVVCARMGWAAPFLDAGRRAAAWLDRLHDPATGDVPNLGHHDGTCLFPDVADPRDARPSLARWPLPPHPARWAGRGVLGWRTARGLALLRVPGSRFRPAHADLLHVDLWLDGINLLRDGGTGSYHPAPDDAWWTEALAGVAGHNTAQFDAHPQMARHGRFLLGPWPAGAPLPDGGWTRDRAGNRHVRRVALGADTCRMEDRLDGPFGTATLRWRLCPGDWRPEPDGATGPARIRVVADGPVRIGLAHTWESRCYGRVDRVPCLEVVVPAPGGRIVTTAGAV